ncbi:hypothetical protein LI170_15615, partial [Desulfovibrio desulfuricans]|uniref:hypothetical protein n=1 Tax=Desulfovibrio desulfuricans TaxID=876 RepID=UPI001D088D31|nr:hypothetical protein [Desulfovibrio desulfuricans]
HAFCSVKATSFRKRILFEAEARFLLCKSNIVSKKDPFRKRTVKRAVACQQHFQPGGVEWTLAENDGLRWAQL